MTFSLYIADFPVVPGRGDPQYLEPLFPYRLFVPTLLNVSMIVFAVFLTPYFNPPVMALGWAVLVGGLAQLLYQLPHLKKRSACWSCHG
nr:hypothetical protein GCM10020185_45800 [Pseudomonas brassicacearum subsp. brassicacearum]